MFAIWNEFARLVSDAAPPFAVGLMLSAGAQWLVTRSQWAARAVSWVAQSVPGAALAGAALPGCAMTTVPLAIPLKRQGAGDGPLLAFIITSALLGPASIVLTFTMFGLVWGALRVALPLIAVCGLGVFCPTPRKGSIQDNGLRIGYHFWEYSSTTCVSVRLR